MNHPFYVYCRYTHLNMRANMTYTIHTMCGPNTKRVWRYDCITPKKKLPKGHSQQVWLEDLGYNFIIPPSQDTLQIFFAEDDASQVQGGKVWAFVSWGRLFIWGYHEAFRMFFVPNQLWIRQKPTIRIQLSGCFFQWIFQVLVKGW